MIEVFKERKTFSGSPLWNHRGRCYLLQWKLFILINALAFSPLLAQNNSLLFPNQLSKLTNSNSQEDDGFGFSTVMDGDTLLVGAVNDNSGRGAVHVFERNSGGLNNWGHVIELTGDESNVGDKFGASLILSGDFIAVGAPLDDELNVNSGAVYVFERNRGGPGNWGQYPKIKATVSILDDSAAHDKFGNSVAILADTLLVGSPDDDDAGPDSGSIYVFEHNPGGSVEWISVDKFTVQSFEGQIQKSFGFSLALSAETLIVGAPFDDLEDVFFAEGSAYVFERDAQENWNQVKQLKLTLPVFGDSFGYSVAIDEDTILVGAPFVDTNKENDNDVGAAYVYRKNAGGTNNWGLVETLLSDNEATLSSFGFSVGISAPLSGEGFAVVGAPFEANEGRAYLFQRSEGGANQWGQIADFSALDSGSGDQFAHSALVSGDEFLLGAVGGDDEGGANAGAAYLFNLLDFGITTHPQAITGFEEGSVGFNVEVVGSGSFSYQWRFDGVDLQGETGDTLLLDDLGENDEGSYDVLVSNAGVTVNSLPAQLSVVPGPIVTHPESQIVSVGETLSFSVITNGSALFNYQWRADGVDIAEATGSSLILDNVQENDSGFYTVVVIHPSGASIESASAQLTVRSAGISFAAWEDSFGLPLEEKGIIADADNDGDGNLMEYVLGRSPLAGNLSIRPEISLQGNELEFRFSLALQAVRYQIEVKVSDNLENWTAEGVQLNLLGTDSDFENWVASIPINGPFKFVRLLVEPTF